jgi:hypothetical protein
MQVVVISETIQEFNGVKYYRCGSYFSSQQKHVRGSRRLHRKVWEYFNGEIPKGMHIHHKDENRANNQIENLEVLHSKTHLSNHMTAERREIAKANIVAHAVPMAKFWHKSLQGREWHSQHAKRVADSIPMITKHCQLCGAEFQTKKHMDWKAKYCHQNCKMKARRRRLNPSLIPKPRKTSIA